jgi:hypothetical protein
MLIGCVFLIGFKDVTIHTGILRRPGPSHGSSGADQFLTILGGLLLVFGFGYFLFS